MTPEIRPLVAGNWKMNGLRASLSELFDMAGAYDTLMRARLDLAVGVPATLLHAAANAMADSGISIAAQDCHANLSGAHTGDISAEMIADCGAHFVIVGHSERRTDHNESNGDVRQKAQAALRAGLVPIVCIGETKQQREDGLTLAILAEQLEHSLPDAPDLAIAYEPVWAIGTGLTPTLEDIAKAHGFIRHTLQRRFGEAGAKIRILYGGSVKPSNAGDILAVVDVDGALVGGASLKAQDLMAICRSVPV